MLGPILFAIAGFIVWRVLVSGQQFLPEFSRLLTSPAIERGPFSVFSGRSYATGRFGDRDVAIRLQQRRGEHQLGYLVIAVRTSGAHTLDSSEIDARIQDEAGRRALFAIAASDLLLTVEDGWLKTMWKPIGFVVFPGRFAAEKWRPVLEAMRTIATSLERSV